MIPLPGAERLPASLAFAGESWERKRELHVTVVGTRTKADPAAMTAAAAGLRFAVRPLGVYRDVRFEGRRALIERVDLLGQEEFCVRLEASLGRAVPRMPAHVTLYTEPSGIGIGLYSEAQLLTLSKPAEVSIESPWRLDGDGAILGA
ncbi:MAG: hypothetical protein M0D55_04005 [Elusimicrobiota bacterium]|nr:MAG: hypothetical protein M0D55_04005 [Elusimicrobiota bacterium]